MLPVFSSGLRLYNGEKAQPVLHRLLSQIIGLPPAGCMTDARRGLIAGHLGRLPVTIVEKACLSYICPGSHATLGSHVAMAAHQLHQRSIHSRSQLHQEHVQALKSALPQTNRASLCRSPPWQGFQARAEGGPAFSSIAALTCARSPTATVRVHRATAYANICIHAVSMVACSDVSHRLGSSVAACLSHIASAASKTQPGQLDHRARCLHTSSVLADSVKRKRGTKMKRHKWKKRMRLLRRKTKASRGGRA